jgi:hypothetical protein
MRSGWAIEPHLAAAAAAPLLAAVGWWWVVFHQLILAGYITLSRALPCMAGGSARCALAQALCSGEHLLGIRHYDATLFWIGVSIASEAAAIPTLARIPGAAVQWRGTKSVRSSPAGPGAVMTS